MMHLTNGACSSSTTSAMSRFEIAIHQRLCRFPVPNAIWDEYHLDQGINDRGVLVDKNLVG